MAAPNEWDLQVAIQNELIANQASLDALSSTGTVTLYDFVPQDADNPQSSSTQFPFITTGDISSAEEDDKSVDGLDTDYQLHVYSRFRGRKECRQLMDQLRRLLHHNNTLSIPDGSIILITHERTVSPFIDSDGHTYHGVVRFRIRNHTLIGA